MHAYDKVPRIYELFQKNKSAKHRNTQSIWLFILKGSLELQPMPLSEFQNSDAQLLQRVQETAALFARRRYAVPLKEFSSLLLGGAEDPDRVIQVVKNSPLLDLQEGFIIKRGQEWNLEACLARRASHKKNREKILSDARAFSLDLLQAVPFVRAICLTGSLVSGGYLPSDDVDLNLFVDDRYKYATYLTSFLLSLKYSLKYRKKPQNIEGKTPLLPKVICINVIFRERDALPFLRRDRYLGFELLLQEPIYGVSYYRDIIRKNNWLTTLFPQIQTRLDPLTDQVKLSAKNHFHTLWKADRLGISETTSRLISRGIFATVQWSRRKNPKAKQHVARIRQFQYPYGVFQD